MWFWAWDYIINVGLVFLTIGSYKVLAVGGGCCRSGPLLFSIFWIVFFFFFGFLLLSDYDEKAEDAVDYEDFDEQYEGPEIQATSEEDHLLPKKEYFSTEVSIASLKPTPVFDDENYDEELEQEQEVVDNNLEVQTTSLTGVVSIIFYYPISSSFTL